MGTSTIELPQTVAILYDSRGHILCVTAVHPPYKHEELNGLPAWHALAGNDVLMCKASVMTCLESGKPQTFDAHVNHIGHWRTTLWPCYSGRVRIVGIAKQWPAEVFELTERQRQICRLLAAGSSSRDVAHALDLSINTVDNHRLAIAARLKIKPYALPAWCGRHAEWL